jgi:ribosomal-protein-alanine acetyltransferase
MMHSLGERAGESSAVTVRRMSASDGSAALSILQESPEAALWSQESLLESADRGIAWAAELGGRVTGILIGRAAADEFEILNLAVAKAHRRRGIATQLFAAALEHARTVGAKKAYLEVRATNEGAIAFYSRMGFRVSGRRPNYYRNPVEDAVLLSLPTNGTAR